MLTVWPPHGWWSLVWGDHTKSKHSAGEHTKHQGRARGGLPLSAESRYSLGSHRVCTKHLCNSELFTLDLKKECITHIAYMIESSLYCTKSFCPSILLPNGELVSSLEGRYI